jgi:hypothetical protein
MSFELSTHVYERLELRKISLEDLLKVLNFPEQVLTQEDGTKVYQSRVIIDEKVYLLRAFVNDAVEPNRVKSVYRTSQIKKYWRSS